VSRSGPPFQGTKRAQLGRNDRDEVKSFIQSARLLDFRDSESVDLRALRHYLALVLRRRLGLNLLAELDRQARSKLTRFQTASIDRFAPICAVETGAVSPRALLGYHLFFPFFFFLIEQLFCLSLSLARIPPPRTPRKKVQARAPSSRSACRQMAARLGSPIEEPTWLNGSPRAMCRPFADGLSPA